MLPQLQRQFSGLWSQSSLLDTDKWGRIISCWRRQYAQTHGQGQVDAAAAAAGTVTGVSSLVQRHWNEWLARGSEPESHWTEATNVWQGRPAVTSMSALRTAATVIVRAMARRDRTGRSGWNCTRITADTIARTVMAHEFKKQCHTPTIGGVEPPGLLVMGRLCGQWGADDSVSTPGALMLTDSTGSVPVCAEGDGMCVASFSDLLLFAPS